MLLNGSLDSCGLCEAPLGRPCVNAIRSACQFSASHPAVNQVGMDTRFDRTGSFHWHMKACQSDLGRSQMSIFGPGLLTREGFRA